MREIARSLNISTSLVSKVLNNRLGTSGASQSTIDAILAKARELNYQKNTAAAGLITGRHEAIGVFIHHHGEPGSDVTSQLVEGVAEEASRQQQRLLLQFYLTIDDIRAIMYRAHSNTVDGLLLAGVPHADVLAELRAMHPELPLVTVHDEQIHTQVLNIGMDQAEVVRLATQHVIERGCRRIAHLRTWEYRYQGYCLALREAGMSLDEKLVVKTAGFSFAAGYQAAQELLNRGIPFDAVVAQSDQQAAAVEHVLLSDGRKIGTDVKIIGVDDCGLCLAAPIPLSSVSQKDRQRGALGVRALMSLINHQNVPELKVSPEVHARASTV